ncbi:hypothetical protein TIFTF001_028338 [Ficus carica]|uniref:Uncharacterized protein n=1 Tax=Ficus carica TaxID=3494 RepID=A0AA88DPT5_FICCA|nr:hypothetical protein TIFTF001_028338 [Ficus carica]
MTWLLSGAVYASLSTGDPSADAEQDASAFGIDSSCRRGKELRKPPPKALLFESSLWKDFVVIQSGKVKQILSWVDWPFVIRGALRKLFNTLLFIKPLSDKEALITELALNTMKIDFPSPKEILVRKQEEKEVVKAITTAKVTEAAQALIPPHFPLIESSP